MTMNPGYLRVWIGAAYSRRLGEVEDQARGPDIWFIISRLWLAGGIRRMSYRKAELRGIQIHNIYLQISQIHTTLIRTALPCIHQRAAVLHAGAAWELQLLVHRGLYGSDAEGGGVCRGRTRRTSGQSFTTPRACAGVSRFMRLTDWAGRNRAGGRQHRNMPVDRGWTKLWSPWIRCGGRLTSAGTGGMPVRDTTGKLTSPLPASSRDPGFETPSICCDTILARLLTKAHCPASSLWGRLCTKQRLGGDGFEQPWS